MATRFILLLSFLVYGNVSKSQTFTETFGTISSGSNNSIATQAFDNEPLFTYSGTGDMRGTVTFPSLGNGTNANVLFNANGEDLIISGFNTNDMCASISFTIRILKTTNAEDGSNFDIQYSTTSSTGPWTTIGSPTMTTGTGSSNNYQSPADITLSSPPAGIVAFRFVRAAGTADFRLDNLIITGSGGSCILPVELLKFDVKAINFTTLLTFSTATETNNSHFIIERSADARTFSEIGQVRGAGTTQEPHDYTFTDEKPLQGTNYYRLRQVDYDGTESFSPVVSVVFGKTDHITIAPSPATDRVNIHLEEALNADGQWQVFDNTGRQVLSGTWEAESADYELDVNILPEGMYAFRLTVGSQVQVKQFRKL